MKSNSHDGAMLSPKATQIETFSGQFVDVYDPDPSTITLEDVAHALALTCRYGGHVKRFYSVAEHSLLVTDLVVNAIDPDLPFHSECRDPLARAAFLHDAAEAFLGDVVAPLKFAQRRAEFDYPGAIHRASYLDDFTGAYEHLTRSMEKALGERFDVDPKLFDATAVKLADMLALKVEAAALTHSGGASWRWTGELPHDGKLPEGVVWRGGTDSIEHVERIFLNYAKWLCVR